MLLMSDFPVLDPRAVLSVSPQTWLTEGDPLTLICQVHSFFTGWTFSWFTLTVSAENSRHYNLLSDWCESESGANHHPVNITVHSGVILESPVHPLTEGDNLILRCLYQHNPPSNLRVDFYKDGSLIQNQTTETSITTVSKSHEGFYYCKHPTRGESPKSWISVRASTDSRSDGLNPMITGVTAGLTVAVLIIVFLVLLWCYRNVKDSKSGPTEHIYDEIELKSATKQKKKKEKKGKLKKKKSLLL
uniref:Ig-like domain-containing protein n=1 Tax=Cyprinus carpio TaxID=7962 RepID=A0A8C1MD93_CYPCA